MLTVKAALLGSIDLGGVEFRSLETITPKVHLDLSRQLTTSVLSTVTADLASSLQRLTHSQAFENALRSLVRSSDLTAVLEAARFQIPGLAVARVQYLLAGLESPGILAEVKLVADTALESLRHEVVGDIGGPETQISEDGWLLPENPDQEVEDSWAAFLAIYTIAYPFVAPLAFHTLRTFNSAKTAAKGLANANPTERALTAMGTGALFNGSPAAPVVALVMLVVLAVMHDANNAENSED